MSVIRRRRLYEDVAERVEKRIRDDDFVPGAQLPSERELMREFGVGRPAIREALFHLSKMGLIELKSGERARVTEPTPRAVVEQLAGTARYFLSNPDGVRHFQEIRAFLEAGLARYAAEHASPADLADLAAALENNRLSLADRRKFAETDVAFHYAIAIIPRNPIFTALHAAIFEWLKDQRTITLSEPGQIQTAYAAHVAIYDAICARDLDRAEREMRVHLEQVAAIYARIAGGGA
jgi:GntR family transcriptional repressor for pyruvate dehydrogenase complex